jgi:DNA-binding MarR family transcriptional regulator
LDGLGRPAGGEEVDEQTAKELLTALGKFRQMNRKHRIVGDIPQAEFYILGAIKEKLMEKRESGEEEPAVMVSEIAGLMNMRMPAVSRVLGSMERKGLIERIMSPNDRRVVYLKLTPAGEGMLKCVMNHSVEMMMRVMEQMGEEDVKEFTRLLTKLYDIISAM